MSDITHTLTPDQQAARALAFESTKAQLVQLASETASLTRVDTDDNLAAAKAARARLRTARTTIEKTGKAARDDANKFQKAVIAKERELVGVIQPEEERLAGLVEAEERRREDAARAIREEEERRAARVAEAFGNLRGLPTRALTAASIEEVVVLETAALSALDDQGEFPEDLRSAARYEANVALNAVRAELDKRRRVEAERAELERLRALVAQQAAQAETQTESVDPPKAGEEARPAEQAAVPPVVAERVQAASLAAAEASASVQRLGTSLLAAARAAHAFLEARGFGSHRVALDLAEAIDEADVPGGGA
jgi:hypothetical protein